MLRPPRPPRRRIYSERVDTLMLEVYTTRPHLMFRDLITGRFVRRPDWFTMSETISARTGGGKEPLECEIIVSTTIETEYLRQLDYERIIEYLNEVEGELINEGFRVATENFGKQIRRVLEAVGRELTLEKRPRIIKKWRHYAREEEWKVKYE